MRSKRRTRATLSVLLGCGACLAAIGTSQLRAHAAAPAATGAESPNAPPSTCTPGIPVTSQLTRLTNEQYENTIEDLIFLGVPPSIDLPFEHPGAIDAEASTAYQALAAALAVQLIADPVARAKALPCFEDNATCVHGIITDFGLRAYRRPLTPTEVSKLELLYTERATLGPNGTFEESVQGIVQAMLQSPSFLQRSELSQDLDPTSGYFLLSSYEMATRLSYMLWQSMPDAALFEAAAADGLQTKEQLLAQAVRMLQLPRAHDMVIGFHAQYAGIGPDTRWDTVEKDPDLFPAFRSEQVPQFAQEMRLFFEDVSFTGGGFGDLFTSPVAFVSADTAPYYGLDPADFTDELQRLEVNAEQRPGLLTRVGFLATHAGYDRTSPIARGAFVQNRLLCMGFVPNPEALAIALPTDPELRTNRERVDAQTAAPDCQSCHTPYINAAGYPLEGFDALGAVQTLDNGVEIDTHTMLSIDDATVEVDGPAALSAALTKSPRARRCYAEQWVAYAYDRAANSMDDCTVQYLTNKLIAGDDYTILNLIADLTQSESFSRRLTQASQSEPPAQGSADPVFDVPDAPSGSAAGSNNPTPTASAPGSTTEAPTDKPQSDDKDPAGADDVGADDPGADDPGADDGDPSELASGGVANAPEGASGDNAPGVEATNGASAEDAGAAVAANASQHGVDDAESKGCACRVGLPSKAVRWPSGAMLTAMLVAGLALVQRRRHYAKGEREASR